MSRVPPVPTPPPRPPLPPPVATPPSVPPVSACPCLPTVVNSAPPPPQALLSGIEAELSRSLLDAAHFAAIKHSTQRRKDPEATPYINHPIGVAHILCVEGLVYDSVVLQAALLHDTVEDTNTTLDEIEQRFGARVRSVVSEVTDDKRLPKTDRKLHQVQHAASWSREARLVCLADKLYNVRDAVRQTPVNWTSYDVKAYVSWALDVVNRIRGTNHLLEAKFDHVLQDYGVLPKLNSD